MFTAPPLIVKVPVPGLLPTPLMFNVPVPFLVSALAPVPEMSPVTVVVPVPPKVTPKLAPTLAKVVVVVTAELKKLLLVLMTFPLFPRVTAPNVTPALPLVTNAPAVTFRVVAALLNNKVPSVLVVPAPTAVLSDWMVAVLTLAPSPTMVLRL